MTGHHPSLPGRDVPGHQIPIENLVRSLAEPPLQHRRGQAMAGGPRGDPAEVLGRSAAISMVGGLGEMPERPGNAGDPVEIPHRIAHAGDRGRDEGGREAMRGQPARRRNDRVPDPLAGPRPPRGAGIRLEDDLPAVRHEAVFLVQVQIGREHQLGILLRLEMMVPAGAERDVAEIDEQALAQPGERLAQRQDAVLDMPVELGEVEAGPVDLERIPIVVLGDVALVLPVLERGASRDVVRDPAGRCLGAGTDLDPDPVYADLFHQPLDQPEPGWAPLRGERIGGEVGRRLPSPHRLVCRARIEGDHGRSRPTLSGCDTGESQRAGSERQTEKSCDGVSVVHMPGR